MTEIVAPVSSLQDKIDYIEHIAMRHRSGECLIWPYRLDRDGYPLFASDHPFLPSRAHQYLCVKVRGPKPTERHEMAHTCGVRACMNPHHVQWKSRKQNQDDRITHGTHDHGDRSKHAKLTNAQAAEIRSSSESYGNLARKYGVSKGVIAGVKTCKTYKPEFCQP